MFIASLSRTVSDRPLLTFSPRPCSIPPKFGQQRYAILHRLLAERAIAGVGQRRKPVDGQVIGVIVPVTRDDHAHGYAHRGRGYGRSGCGRGAHMSIVSALTAKVLARLN